MSHLDFRVFKSIRNSKKHEVCQVPVESPYLWPIAVHLDVISISFGHRDVPRGRTVHGGCEAVHAFARGARRVRGGSAQVRMLKGDRGKRSKALAQVRGLGRKC